MLVFSSFEFMYLDYFMFFVVSTIKPHSPGVDRLEHEVEYLRVQQRQGYQSAARQPLEAGYTHVQQVQ